MRLNRFLSASGVASRRRGEDIIRVGRVCVNDEIVTDPACAVDPGKDTVTVDGTPARIAAVNRYFVLNKPSGVIVSRGDTHKRRTVFDLLGPETGGVFPVGRLDYTTAGVLLLTDDGDCAHRLMHPSYEIEKVYRARVAGKLGSAEVEAFRRGLLLDDGPVSPARMKVISSDEIGSTAEVVVHEGRKRQVRRMFDAVGHPVRYLERINFSGITCAGLAPGAYRPLSTHEIAVIRKFVALEYPEDK